MKRNLKPSLAMLMSGMITIEECERRINDIYFPPILAYNTAAIFTAIENTTGITPEQLKSKTRVSEVVDIKIIFAYILRKYENATLGRIGIYINKDHSTIIHYLKKYDSLYETERDFRVKANKVLNCLSSVLVHLENKE